MPACKKNAFFATCFSVVAILADTLTASMLVPWYQAVHLGYLCALVVCFFPLIYRRQPYFLYIAFASVLVATFNVLELLHLAGYVGLGYLTHIGFLAFIFVQVLMLSTRSADNYRQITKLSGELETNNFKLQGSWKFSPPSTLLPRFLIDAISNRWRNLSIPVRDAMEHRYL
ncbi:MAG: hypothetical protein V7709_14710 [Halioglobus sp.]